MTLVIWAALSGCNYGTSECTEEVGCGLGAVCIDGACIERNCSTSGQCGIEQFCSAQGVCTPGCKEDTDCRFGDYCEEATATCQAAECSDTRLDCGFQEFCSPAGECYDAGGYYCRSCNDDGDCGGAGNMCLSGYCGVTCVADSDCPSGYDCLPVVDLSGNVVSYQCWTYCWLYEE